METGDALIAVALLAIGALVSWLVMSGRARPVWGWVKSHALEAGLIVGAALGVTAAIVKLRGRRSAQKFDVIRTEQRRADEVQDQREQLTRAIDEARRLDSEVAERGIEVEELVEEAKERVRRMNDDEVAEAFRQYAQKKRVDRDDMPTPNERRKP